MENCQDIERYQKYLKRYLHAAKVTLPAAPPYFNKKGYCQWCGKKLTGQAKKYCAAIVQEYYGRISWCSIWFFHWWDARPAFKRAIFLRDNFTCQICGIKPLLKNKPWLPDLSQLEVDHINPVANGGKTELNNLQTLCMICNRRKGVKACN